MEQFLLLLVLAGGSKAFSLATETKCDATHSTSPCSPVVGGSVGIKLFSNATGYRIQCFKDGQEMFSVKKGKVNVVEAYKNRTEFIIGTATLKIINVEWNDAGQYKVTFYDSEGQKVTDVIFRLEVKGNIFLIMGIVGIVVVVVVLLIVPITCCVCWRLKQRRKSKGSQANMTPVTHGTDL